MDDEPDVEVFYADAVDEDGNVAEVTVHSITYSNGTVRATKIPREEMALEDMPTLRANLADLEDS